MTTAEECPDRIVDVRRVLVSPDRSLLEVTFVGRNGRQIVQTFDAPALPNVLARIVNAMNKAEEVRRKAAPIAAAQHANDPRAPGRPRERKH